MLDGIDGCGKSTQARRLVEHLRLRDGPQPLHLREPGSTPAGEALRALLLDPEVPLDAGAETLLFVAARRAMLEQCVSPALAAGRDVVCERFHASTFAYQSAAGGLDGEAVLELMERWAGEPVPDVVLWLDLELGEAQARSSARGTSDRFEARGPAFQASVAEGFARYAERFEHVRRVDAGGDEGTVAERIQRAVQRV